MPPSTLAAPKYWLSWIGLGLMAVVAYLPHPVRMALGRGLGRLSLRLLKRRRHIVQRNLELCFPDIDPAERDKMVFEVFRSGGMGMMETAVSWIRGSSSLRERATLHGEDNLIAASQGSHGVILLGMHMSTLDATGTILSSHFTFDVMYRRNDNPFIEWIMTRGREAYYSDVIERNDVRTMIRNLKQGHIVWYAPDQDYGARNAIFSPFFGVDASTLTAISRISSMTGAVVVPLRHYRQKNGRHYDIYMDPPWQDFPGDSIEADVARINGFVQQAVERAPDQYWWFHRRFKTRPPGEAGFY